MTGRPDASALPETAIPQPRWRWTASRREAAWGYTFISPWIVGFVLFTMIPMALALYFSLTDFDLRRPEAVKFVGLDNYIRMLSDPHVVESIGVTLRFAILTVPATIALSVGPGDPPEFAPTDRSPRLPHAVLHADPDPARREHADLGRRPERRDRLDERHPRRRWASPVRTGSRIRSGCSRHSGSSACGGSAP